MSFYAQNCVCYTIFSVFFKKYKNKYNSTRKPEFDLRIKVKPASRLKTKPKTKAEAAGYRRHKSKEHQIGESKIACKENIKQWQAALKTEMFPLIKDSGTIDSKLDVKVTNGKKNI